MSGGRTALRKLDLAASVAVLCAGLAAQAAMWVASQRPVYPTAAVSLIVVTVLTITLPSRWNSAKGREGSRCVACNLACAVKLAACVAPVVVCIVDVAETAIRSERPPSTVAAVGALLVIAHVAHMATVGSRRDAVIGLALVCLMLLQAGIVARGVVPLVPLAIALCGIVAALALIHRAGLQPKGRSVGSGRFAPMRFGLAQLSGVALVGALVFVLLPNSLQLGHLSPSDRSPAASTVGESTHTQALTASLTDSLDLRVRGSLSENPVFMTAASAPTYWQGMVYDRYDGTSWTATPAQAPSRWTTSKQDSVIAQDAPADATPTGVAALVSRSDSVQVLSLSALGTVFAPGQATSYVGPGTVETDASGNVSVVQRATGASSLVGGYSVTSVRATASPESLASATGAEPADPRWLQLPANLPARVGDLATQLAKTQTTRLGTVSAVNDYLRNNETYDLAAPVPPPGADTVDSFLFVSHSGFCEQFASASVVMLRTLGIPARLVTGYAHGDTTTDPGTMVMRGNDAHAWVQVWYPGIGWVDSDPTAGAALALSTAAATASSQIPTEHWLLATLSITLVWLQDERWPILLAGAGALATLALLVFWPRHRRRRATSLGEPRLTSAVDEKDIADEMAVTERASGRRVLEAYLRLAATLPDAATTSKSKVRQIAIQLNRSAADVVNIDVALDLLEQECYGVDLLTRTEVDAAVETFDALAQARLRMRRLDESDPRSKDTVSALA